jgi:CheY-like chemotaxis protein
VFSRAAAADETPRRVRHAVILLVDDEDLVRAGAADMLTEAGYSVEEASSGYRAVQLLKAGLRPDAVVTDYAMPGMNGAELAREVRKVAPGAPVLMITGYATLTDREAGDLPRLAKPFRQNDLVSAVEELMQTAAKTPG